MVLGFIFVGIAGLLSIVAIAGGVYQGYDALVEHFHKKKSLLKGTVTLQNGKTKTVYIEKGGKALEVFKSHSDWVRLNFGVGYIGLFRDKYGFIGAFCEE